MTSHAAAETAIKLSAVFGEDIQLAYGLGIEYDYFAIHGKRPAGELVPRLDLRAPT